MKEIDLEKQAQDYSRSSYARPPKQSEDEADYIQAVAYYSFIAGYKAKESEIQQQPEPIEDITRVEVIDSKGRSYVNWDEKNKIELSYQDNNRTLKILITQKSKVALDPYLSKWRKQQASLQQKGNNLPEQQGKEDESLHDKINELEVCIEGLADEMFLLSKGEEMFADTHKQNWTLDYVKRKAAESIEKYYYNYQPKEQQGKELFEWVKASMELPEKWAEVLVRSIKTGAITRTSNMGHNVGWNVGLDKQFQWDNTEWLKPVKLINQQGNESDAVYEPYMGWCDVEGCENEGANGGGCWRETGYWTVCSKHSQEHREGKPQPKMKQSAIDRENSRDSNGYLTI